MRYATILAMLTLIIWGCASQRKSVPKSPAEALLHEAIKAHGGDGYYDGDYSFTFRGKRYGFSFDKKKGYTYSVSYDKDGQSINDQLINGVFERKIDGQLATLSDKDVRRGSNGLNSVVYFATLPHKLLDPAVNIAKMPDATIKGEMYEVLQVTFDQAGGGEDHDDTYYYWINRKDHKIDYLAYNYHTGKGGVRFRSAYNRRSVNGVTFQDYINYKAPKETPLDQLPKLYEDGQLKELSRVETESVTHG